MLLVRQLLYKEKTLDDFDIDSDKSVFKLFFDLLLDMDGTRVTDGNVENNITNMFNDACFICNAVIQMKRPYLHYGYFRELASRFSPNDTYHSPNPARADVVMCMVYFLLEEHGDNAADLVRFKNTIDTNLRERSRESNERYEQFYDAYYKSIPTYLTDEFVVKLPITQEDLKHVCWSDISNNYDKQCLKDIVSFWRDPHERNMIIDDIEKEIKQNMEDELPF